LFLQLRRIDRRRGRAQGVRLIPALALVALIYTTPWDNYLVANRIWWYRPDWVLGLTLGWVPIEEYAFFILQTALTGAWTSIVISRTSTTRVDTGRDGSGLRWIAALAVAAAWLTSLASLVVGPPRLTYVGLIFAWALPPLGLQVAFGADVLWRGLRGLLLSIGAPTIYLILADALAIRSGTWVINPDLSLAARVAGFPLEEALFFIVTNTLVAVGITLGASDEGRARLRGWMARIGIASDERAQRMPTGGSRGHA
jgi:lycopene cyclase domain-containing protein